MSACLYRSVVTHERFGRAAHRLKYRVAYALVDLESLSEGRSPTRLFGFNRPGLLSIRARDHGEGSADDLAKWARSYLQANGMKEEAAKILLFTLPRMFGFVFNPVSFYFVYDREERLHHILCEVNNTFGGRHFYLLRVSALGALKQKDCAKEFYVSPFLETSGKYSFKVRSPGQTISVGIDYRRENGERQLSAYLSGRRARLDAWTCFRILVEFPLMTLGVVAAIYWEALVLWFKGAPFYANSRSRRISPAVPAPQETD